MKPTIRPLRTVLSAFLAAALRLHAAAPVPGPDRSLPMDPFDTNQVISLEISIAEDDWKVLRYQHREAEFFPEEGVPLPTNAYSWFSAEASMNGTSLGPVEIRKKGYIGSNDIRRPGLKLRLKQSKADSRSDVPKTLARAQFDLTLNNNLQDPSLIRQYLTYEIFRRAGIPAPRCSFVRLSLNNRVLGIYTCVQPVNAAFLQEHFGNSNGNLYEGGRSDFRTNWFQNFEIKNNHAKNDRSDLARAAAAIEQSRTSILPALNALFDADAFFRFWATESLVNQSDGYSANMNNFYLYHNPASDKFAFIPWGADSSLHSGRPLNTVRGDPKSVIAVAILPNRIYNSDEGAAKYRARLRTLLETVWDEKILTREVNRLDELLTRASPSQSAEIKANIDSVRRFIKNRRSEIASELTGPVPPVKSKPLELARRRNVAHFSGRFSTVLSSENPPANSSAELSGTLWDKPLTFHDLSLRAQAPGRETGERILVILSGPARPGNEQYVLYLALDPDSCRVGKPIPIDNTHITGVFASQERYLGMLRGSLLLTRAAQDPGGEIAGDFTVDLFSKLPKPGDQNQ